MLSQRLCFVLRLNVLKKLRNSVKNGKTHFSSTSSAPFLLSSNSELNQSLKYKNTFQSWNFRFCSILSPIKYLHNENKHAHLVFENDPKYSCLLSPGVNKIEESPKLFDTEFEKILQKDWNNKTIDKICNDFRTVSLHVRNLDIDISDPKFDNLSQSIVNQSMNFNLDQICHILHYLSVWKLTPTRKSHNYVEIWNALDKACMSHVNDWKINDLLKVCNCWYHMNLGGISGTNLKSTSKLSRRVASLNPQQLVSTLFYFNLRRVFPSVIDIYDYQVHINSHRYCTRNNSKYIKRPATTMTLVDNGPLCIKLFNALPDSLQNICDYKEFRRNIAVEKYADTLSLEELAVCAMGFFKTKKIIRSPRVLQVMVAKCTAQASTVDPLTLTSILKACRSSLPVELADQLYNLLDALLPRIPELPVVSCLHVALAGSNLQIYHDKIINAVLVRFFEDLSRVRLKDIERIVFVMSLFNLPSTSPSLPGVQNIYKSLLDEVIKPHREAEVNNHARCLANILNHLTVSRTYHYPAIDKVMKSEFVSKFFTPAMEKSGLEVLSLDVAVEIDCPDYKGARLSEKTRRFVSKSKSQNPFKWEDPDVKKGSQGDRLLREIIGTSQNLVKHSDKVFVGHTLPNYFRPDIIFRVREDYPTNFLPIPDSVTSNSLLGQIRKPDGEGKWICIVLGGWNLLVRGSDQPTGLLAQKLRFLSAIGYNPILLKWNEWQSSSKKPEFIQQKINEVLGNTRSAQVQRSY